MRTAIMGTGGMGGYIGGRLAVAPVKRDKAGGEVVFIARGEHLKAIQQKGLRVISPSVEFRVKPALATDRPEEIGQVDLVLFCVKSYDAVEAARLIKPIIGPKTAILPVLNGIDHIELLNEICGTEHVLGGVAFIIANIQEPGVIKHLAYHSLSFGEQDGRITDRCEEIREVLSVDGLEVEVVDNILERMWLKFAAMCGGGGVFTVMRGDKETIFGFEETQALIHQAVAEGVRVAQAKGFQLPDTFPDEILSATARDTPPEYKPSILVDLERGRRLEVEALNGSLSRYGKELGIPTPVNDFIYACLKPYAGGTNKEKESSIG